MFLNASSIKPDGATLFLLPRKSFFCKLTDLDTIHCCQSQGPGSVTVLSFVPTVLIMDPRAFEYKLALCGNCRRQVSCISFVPKMLSSAECKFVSHGLLNTVSFPQVERTNLLH